MIREYEKGKPQEISLHFCSTEFDCKCTYNFCTYTLIDLDLITALEKLRKKLRVPISINSGFRCSVHNKDEDGKPGSLHLTGKAADISNPSVPNSIFYYQITQIPQFQNGGVGSYKDFFHVDVRGYKARWNG